MSHRTDRVTGLIRNLHEERKENDGKSAERSFDEARADVSRLFREYFRPQLTRLACICAIITLWSGVPFALALTWRFLFDDVLMVGKGIDPSQMTGQIRLVWVFLGMNSGLWVLWNIFHWLFYWLSVTTSQQLVFTLKKQLHEKLQALHIGFYERTPTGRILSRVMDDVEVIRGLVTSHLAALFSGITKVLMGLGLILYLNWKLSVLVIIALPVYAWTFYVFLPRIRRTNVAMRQLNARLYGLATEKISAIQVVMAFARERGEMLSFSRLVHNFVRLRIRLMLDNQKLSLVAASISAIASAGIIYFGGLQIKAGMMSLGDVLAFIGAIGNMFSGMNELTSLMTQVQMLLVVIHRVFTLLDEHEDVVPGAIFLKGMTGKITFDHVTFTYRDQQEPGLTDLTVNIRPGEKIALMGPSGSGKSTVFHLLLRFYDPQKGEIRVGGVNLRDAHPGSVRRHVCLIQQEPMIFSGTIADNIVYGVLDATPAQIMKAAQQAELHDFIMSLPAKYETEVGEHGVTLSGGQKQRLALATALLTDPEILLLDDTTSALDAETEARIRATLTNVLKGRTSLIITQRIATARECDRIIVLERGCIMQEGTHAELLDKEGFYRSIAVQQGWVLPELTETS